MIDVLCLGSPVVNGDAIGPMVGSRLTHSKVNANVIGTVADPVIRSNYNEKLKMLRPGALVVVVDAAIGPRVGYSLSIGPLIPGESIGSDIVPIGDISIKCYTASAVSKLHQSPIRNMDSLASDISTVLTYLINSGKIREYIEM